MRSVSAVVVFAFMGSRALASSRWLGFALLSWAGCYTGLPEGDRSATTGVGVTFGSLGDTESDDVPDSDGESESTSDAVPDLGNDDASESSSGGVIDDPTAPREGALDITPTGVHVNQGIAITIADAGLPIAGGTRSAKIVHGRRTLVFGTWTTAPGFVPRTIRGELHLDRTDGTRETLVSEIAVNGPSGPGELDAHCTWTIEPEQLPAGTRWSVSLHELELVPEGVPTTTPAPSLPAVGNSELDDEDGNQRVRVVLIPYRHQFNGCDRLAPSDAATIDGHRRAMEMQYPIQDIEITLHPEVAFGASMATGDAVLTNVVELRAAEAPAADVYYYGLLWPCDAETNYGGLGYVPFNPSTVEDAPWRAAVGIYYDYAPDYTYQTMVHELGHNHGRSHVACAGTEGETDPGYPIPGGTTGVLGWGIHDGLFRPATNTDYMTYCGTQWASTYAWQRTLSVVDALTVAVGGAPPHSRGDADDPPGALAIVVRDGEVTATGHLARVSATRAEGIARWTMRDGSVSWTALQRDQVPDSTAEFFTVAAPGRGFDDVHDLELDASSGKVTLPRSAIVAATHR
ncbi:MAG: hypothetical protein IAG13_29560 [Deltaproteobacteria bacterium]|nr:hypothetical protein [Nannocystaceae bacterium]